MDKLSILLAIAIIFNLVLNIYSSDGDKEIHFAKPSEESEIYFFDYKLDNGQLRSGKTKKITKELQVLPPVEASDIVYYVIFDEDELDNDDFTKTAYVAQRRKSKVFIEDHENMMKYLLSDEQYLVTTHNTAWDVDDICFNRTNSNDETFNYSLSSINNSRKLYGTTRRITDSSIQRIDVIDEDVSHGEYEIRFTESELSSQETFCRGINRVVSGNQWSSIPVDKIDRSCLLSCIG